MTWILVGALVLGVLAWLFFRPGAARTPSAAALRRRLRHLTHDPAAAERLVEAEMKRHPELDERAILRRVVHRLERDRGR